MATYHLSTRIQSNVPADSLLYDLCIYHMDSDRNKYILVDVKNSHSGIIMKHRVI